MNKISDQEVDIINIISVMYLKYIQMNYEFGDHINALMQEIENSEKIRKRLHDHIKL